MPENASVIEVCATATLDEGPAVLFLRASFAGTGVFGQALPVAAALDPMFYGSAWPSR